MGLKVSDIRRMLTEEYGFSNQDLKGKKKDELEEIVEAAKAARSIVETAEVEEANGHETSKKPCPPPEIRFGDPGWSDYVMTHFQPNELENYMPKVDGLRRVALFLLGVYSYRVDVRQVPENSNNNRATVHVSLTFHKHPLSWGCVVESAADVSPQNTTKEFAIHAVATAESRAEGRALRKALLLNHVLSAEEMTTPTQDDVNSEKVVVAEEMINGMDSMAKMIGIDLYKLAVTVNDNIQSLLDLTKDEAHQVIKQIGHYRSNPSEIPDNVKLTK